MRRGARESRKKRGRDMRNAAAPCKDAHPSAFSQSSLGPSHPQEVPPGSANSNTQGWRAGPPQSAPAWVRPDILTLWKSPKSQDLLNIFHLEPPAILAGFWGENPGPGQLTSAMTCLVAGVSGVYRIFPTSRGLRAFHMMRERGLDSKLFITSLQ